MYAVSEVRPGSAEEKHEAESSEKLPPVAQDETAGEEKTSNQPLEAASEGVKPHDDVPQSNMEAADEEAVKEDEVKSADTNEVESAEKVADDVAADADTVADLPQPDGECLQNFLYPCSGRMTY